ncbi:sulfoxide reductase heme-binding subunit YedZ [Methylocaldum marinum]|uniref:Protein-methionine-sulfoxide reductase heme-binding subunit MsrQ n=1 Tax=Methylocaldum marinum TaxID=1432792 RepID=A0A250KXI2_9GAMM|nr:protein-methionine-sulfoxide reductase heme-binding subunit MsrQ [Methylocaldum marinum]BBA36224.1 sulfoxide reductase heme-binding subunit YedZ [Methylocaldum marinum]
MNIRNPHPKTIIALKRGLFLILLIPLFKLIADGVFDRLGANPIEKITHITGYWTLTLLLATLAVTPLRRLSGWPWPGRFRRMLGLFAFFYGCLHFLTYLVLDQFFDWSGIVKDIGKRPYITVGFTAFLLLIPLALTSTDAMIRRLGGKRWRVLHRLVYLIAVLGVAHFWWLVKKDISGPAADAAILAVLLGFRAIGGVRKSSKVYEPDAGRQSSHRSVSIGNTDTEASP